MIMMDRSRRLSEPLQWGRREKAAVAAVLACLVLALAGLGAYALTSGSPARADCVSVTFASTLGAARLHGCGHQARVICASAGAYPGIADSLSAACRRAGFPFIARN
ncbi:MAG: hypothetical protein ACHQAV_02310 [Solirubrobacterales bacterium]